jgi:hypothetical protein
VDSCDRSTVVPMRECLLELWAPLMDSVISLTMETSTSLSFPLVSPIGLAAVSVIGTLLSGI